MIDSLDFQSTDSGLSRFQKLALEDFSNEFIGIGFYTGGHRELVETLTEYCTRMKQNFSQLCNMDVKNKEIFDKITLLVEEINNHITNSTLTVSLAKEFSLKGLNLIYEITS